MIRRKTASENPVRASAVPIASTPQRQPVGYVIIMGGMLSAWGTSGATGPTLTEWRYTPASMTSSLNEGMCAYPIAVNEATKSAPANATEATRSALHELRRRSGLTWEYLARLFHVSRRSLHLWASGKPLNAAHEEQLQRLLTTIRHLDRGSARATRSVLLEATEDGLLPLDLLADGHYEQVIALLGRGTARLERPSPPPLAADVQDTRRPPAPETRVGALQDRVHQDTGKARAVRAARAKTRDR